MKRRLNSALAAALLLFPTSQTSILYTIGVSSALMIGNSGTLPAAAQQSESAAAITESITVRIEGATQGSGVIFGKEENVYTILTAWHVIKDYVQNEEIQIKTPDGKSHNHISYTKEKIGDYDLGLLRIDLRGEYQVAKINKRKEISPGESLFVGGFPLPSSSVPQRLFRFVPGSLIARSNIQIPGGYQLLYSNQTLPGMSGGPVVDTEGNLIGIHGRAEVDVRLTEQRGIAVKTGTNQAMPIDLINGSDISYKKETEKMRAYEPWPKSIARTVLEFFPDLYRSLLAFFTAEERKKLEELSNNLVLASSLLSIPGQNTGFGGGLLYEANTKEDQIIELTSEVLKIQPKNVHALHMRAVAKSRIRSSNFRDYLNYMSSPEPPAHLRGERFWDLKAYNQMIQKDKEENWEDTKRKHLSDAVEDLTIAIQIRPKSALYFADLARVHLKMSNFGQAIRSIDSAIEIDRQNPDYKYQKGLILFEHPKKSSDASHYCNAMFSAASAGSIPAIWHVSRSLHSYSKDPSRNCFDGRFSLPVDQSLLNTLTAFTALKAMKAPPVDPSILVNSSAFLNHVSRRSPLPTSECANLQSSSPDFKLNHVVSGQYVNPVWFMLYIKSVCMSYR